MEMFINLDVQFASEYCKEIGKIYTTSMLLNHEANVWLIKDVRHEIDVENFPISKIRLSGYDEGSYAGRINLKQVIPDEFLSSETLNKLIDKNYFLNSLECKIVTSVETLDYFCDVKFDVKKDETTGEVLSVDVRYKFDFIKFLEAWKAQGFPETFVE